MHDAQIRVLVNNHNNIKIKLVTFCLGSWLLGDCQLSHNIRFAGKPLSSFILISGYSLPQAKRRTSFLHPFTSCFSLQPSAFNLQPSTFSLQQLFYPTCLRASPSSQRCACGPADRPPTDLNDRHAVRLPHHHLISRLIFPPES